MFGLCLKYSRNKTEAEDNLHDCFITIFEKISQFNHQGSFEGWMKRIAVNTVLNKFRKEKTLEIVREEIEEESSESSLPDLELNRLLTLIQELPNKYRITFNLYVLDGYTHNEIGDLLGTSPGTSKSNLARARSILKKKIDRENLNIA